jgi:hypothetical protein
MSCAALEQTADYANIVIKVVSAENKQALVDLFDKSQGYFSNGLLKLSDVIYKAINDDRKNIADILCELAMSKDVDAKKHAALKNYFKNGLSQIALEMNKSMAK